MTATVSSVRILPMSNDEPEFQSANGPKTQPELQSDYFLGTLVSPPAVGRYEYRERGLSATNGTTVLFQYENAVIASATLVNREDYPQPRGGYRGCLWFDVQSVRVFDPIGRETMRKAWPGKFKKFSQVMQELNADGLVRFEALLRNVRTPKPQHEDQAEELLRRDVCIALKQPSSVRLARIKDASRLPAKYIVLATMYHRSPDVIAEVLLRSRGVCECCKRPAPFDRMSDGTPYLEVHHKKRLADGGEDTVENAVALCPNCHRQSHYGADPFGTNLTSVPS